MTTRASLVSTGDPHEPADPDGKLFQPGTLRSLGTAEAQLFAAVICRRGNLHISQSPQLTGVVPASAANDTWVFQVFGRNRLVDGPLVCVAHEIEDTLRADAVPVGPNGRCLVLAERLVGVATIWTESVPPGVAATVGTASGAFPLVGGGEALTVPGAEGVGVLPIHTDHGLVRLVELRLLPIGGSVVFV